MKCEKTLFLLTALWAAACATACATAESGANVGPGPAKREVVQADQPFIDGQRVPVSVLGDDVAVSSYRAASDHYLHAQEASRANNSDQARAECAAAASGYAKFADARPEHNWSLRMRYEAALLFLQARQFEPAASEALLVFNSKDATKTTQALAAKVAANAAYSAAQAAVKSSKLEPYKFLLAEERGGKPPEPRVPPAEWKNVQDASDRYLKVADTDPDTSPSLPAGRAFSEAAAEISFGFDDMADAQKRFEVILERFPQDTEYLLRAVSLYLETFLVLRDNAGHDAAAEKLRTRYQGLVQNATAEKKVAYQKVITYLRNADLATKFSDAQKLLDAGKFEEAALSFEKLAATPGGGDTVNALHNEAIAWDRAGHPEKALALREKIVKEYPDSRLAPMNELLVARRASETKRYDDSVKLYQEFLAKWPNDRNRCTALQNIASALDTAKKKAVAAEAYLSFGTDPDCAKGDANTRARALYRGGVLFQDAKLRLKAKEAFSAALQVEGVTDAQTKGWLRDAKKQVRK